MLLPFMWAINAVWFFKEAFTKPPFEEQEQIKKCKYSMLITLHQNYSLHQTLYCTLPRYQVAIFESRVKGSIWLLHDSVETKFMSRRDSYIGMQ